MVGAIVAPSMGSIAAARSGFSVRQRADELRRVGAVLPDRREERAPARAARRSGAASAGSGRSPAPA